MTAEEAQSYGIIDAVIAGPEATDRSLHLSRRQ
jgi:ATP-dependent protease ClpP protease subunit